MMNGQDPGWKPAMTGLWRALMPWLGFRAGRGKSTIVVLRAIWLSMLVSWAGFALVLDFVSEGSLSSRPRWVSPLVAGLACTEIGQLLWLRARPLSLDGEAALAASYAQLSLIGFAFTNTAVLFGFVGFFLGGGMLAFLVGIPFGLAGFMIMAPTRSNLDRSQRRIRERGSALSLLTALNGPFQPSPWARKRKGERSPVDGPPEPPTP